VERLRLGGGLGQDLADLRLLPRVEVEDRGQHAGAVLGARRGVTPHPAAVATAVPPTVVPARARLDRRGPAILRRRERDRSESEREREREGAESLHGPSPPSPSRELTRRDTGRTLRESEARLRAP